MKIGFGPDPGLAPPCLPFRFATVEILRPPSGTVNKHSTRLLELREHLVRDALRILAVRICTSSEPFPEQIDWEQHHASNPHMGQIGQQCAECALTQPQDLSSLLRPERQAVAEPGRVVSHLDRSRDRQLRADAHCFQLVAGKKVSAYLALLKGR